MRSIFQYIPCDAKLQGRLVFFILACSFVLARWIFWRMGVRYDDSTLNWFWQFLDIRILQDRLCPALFHLHAQPPLFNLFLGLALKCFAESSTLCFHAIYLLLGFLLYCSLYWLLRQARFPRSLSIVFAFLFSISPGTILYENWLFYSYPTAVLLVLAAVALHRFQTTRQLRPAVAFLIAIAVLCGLRSVFHLIYLLGCVVLVSVPEGKQRKRVFMSSGIAVGLVLLLYLKNLGLFGFFGASSWTGMNLYKMVSDSVNRETIIALAQSGQISPIALVRPFSHLSLYPAIYRTVPERFAEATELMAEKKAIGQPNFNHWGYVSISKAYQHASFQIIRRVPRRYLSGVFDAYLIYFMPSWRLNFLQPNAQQISGYIAACSWARELGPIDVYPFKRAAFGVEPPAERYFSAAASGRLYPLTNLLFLPSLLILICWRSGVLLHRLIKYMDMTGVVFIFMAMTVLYVAILGNAMEIGENNRFRAETDPLIFLLTLMAAKDAWGYFGSKTMPLSKR